MGGLGTFPNEEISQQKCVQRVVLSTVPPKYTSTRLGGLLTASLRPFQFQKHANLPKSTKLTSPLIVSAPCLELRCSSPIIPLSESDYCTSPGYVKKHKGLIRNCHSEMFLRGVC